MTETRAYRALLIGGGGGIATALIEQLLNRYAAIELHVVSRQPNGAHPFTIQAGQSLVWRTLDSLQESQVLARVNEWQAHSIQFDFIASTVGILHTNTIKPEKRLEDIDLTAMQQVFNVNTLVNALWLKQAPRIANKQASTWIVLSARVGSIGDNQLGGWYAYRMSKAALNMLIKSAAVEFKRRLPNTLLVAYHPGTVDSALSKPFKANVKPEKLFTADFTSQQLLSHLQALEVEHNPHFVDWQGKRIPW